MKREYSIYAVVAMLLIMLCTACGVGKKVKPDEGEIAAKAAKAYYEQLFKGKYDVFIKGEIRSQRLPESYRKQLLLNLQKFAEARTKEHARVDSITVVNASFSGKDSTANAYIMLHHADKSKEQILVPMQKVKGVWMMR